MFSCFEGKIPLVHTVVSQVRLLRQKGGRKDASPSSLLPPDEDAHAATYSRTNIMLRLRRRRRMRSNTAPPQSSSSPRRRVVRSLVAPWVERRNGG